MFPIESHLNYGLFGDLQCQEGVLKCTSTRYMI